jgi:hypothetical protein
MIKLVNLLKELYDENLIGSWYGEGSVHYVYNYDKDKVIKFNQNQGEPISDHIKIFDKYPDIFPKVYDIGEDYVILEKLDDDKSTIVRLLKSHGNFLPYHDKSNPDEIYAFFGMSKKAFKMNVGILYKSKRITIEAEGIRLLPEVEIAPDAPVVDEIAE